jgi:hypothetical protein
MEQLQLLISWSDIVKDNPELADKDPAVGMNWDIGQEKLFGYVIFLSTF